MPLSILGFYEDGAVIILTGRGDLGHYGVDALESIRCGTLRVDFSGTSRIIPRD
jgi:hypothetical protein